MAFIKFNANPSDKDTIDCVIRGISVLLDLTWNQVHDLLTEKAGKEHEVYLWRLKKSLQMSLLVLLKNVISL